MEINKNFYIISSFIYLVLAILLKYFQYKFAAYYLSKRVNTYFQSYSVPHQATITGRTED